MLNLIFLLFVLAVFSARWQKQIKSNGIERKLLSFNRHENCVQRCAKFEVAEADERCNQASIAQAQTRSLYLLIALWFLLLFILTFQVYPAFSNDSINSLIDL